MKKVTIALPSRIWHNEAQGMVGRDLRAHALLKPEFYRIISTMGSGWVLRRECRSKMY